MAESLWADSGWPPPLSSLTAYAGFLFYLAPGDNRRPDPTKAQLRTYLDARLDLAPIWQAGKVDIAAGGSTLGAAHARAANADADSKAVPAWCPIIYACDDNRMFAQVETYYRGVLSVPGRPVGAYGGSYLIANLHDRLGVRWFMQAAARSWSAPGDYVSPYAQFWQRDPNVPVAGGVVDQVVPLAAYPTWKKAPVTVMTPDQRLAAYRAEGLRVVEVRSWRTNDRAPVTGLPAGPKNGTVNHHTGGETSDPLRYASTILYDGRSDLPGPLCHDGMFPYDGTIYAVGTGRTNHAGKGDSNVLAQVVAETVPYDRELRPTLNDIDGNARYYGLEVMYDGLHDLPTVGWDAMVRWNAAICRFHGWGGASCIGHREHTNTKPDPGHVDLARLRRDVRDCLAQPAGVWHSTVTPPPPPPPPPPALIEEHDDMPAFVATVPDEGGKIYALVPGKPKLWLGPDEWALARRVYPDATDLAKHGSPFFESQVDVLWALLQPAGAGTAGAAPDAPENFEGVRVGDGEALPVCADPDDPYND